MQLLILLVTSCNKESSNEVVHITPEIEMSTADCVDHVEYVVLEKTDECILSNVEVLRMNKDKIAVQSNRAIYIFNQQGEYLSKVDKMGNASDEYIIINDFQIMDDEIYILSGLQNKIQKYSLDGDYIGAYVLDNSYKHFVFEKNNTIILSSEQCNDKHFNFVRYDLSKKKNVGEIDEFEENQAMSFPYYNAFLNTDEAILVGHPFDYGIYSLQQNQIKKKIEFDFDTSDHLPQGNKNFMEIEERTKYSNVVRFLLSYSKIGNIQYLVYPLFCEYGIKTCLTRIGEDGSNATIKIGNKIDKTYPYFFMGNFLSLESNKLAMVTDASKLISLERRNGMSYFTNNGITEESNPILFFYYLK